MLESYATVDFYRNTLHGTALTDDDELADALALASRHIDSLTYNRIVRSGFAALTDFQKEILQTVTCELADFETENADILSAVLSGYSINGVSQTFSKGWAVQVKNGVAIPGRLYSLLAQTGLCCRSLG